MPWYKLPHADMVMHFDHEMDMEPASAPVGSIAVTTFDVDETCSMPEPGEWTEAT